MAYLNKNQVLCKRINSTDHGIYTFNDIICIYENSNSVWLRKGDFPRIKGLKEHNYLKNKVLNHHLHKLFTYNRKSYGNLFIDYFHNKLNDLDEAKKHGLFTPITKIISSKEEFLVFIDDNPSKLFITKAISNLNEYSLKDRSVTNIGYAQFINYSNYDEFILDNDEPILVQEYIKMQCELRIFFFEKELFSSAIFSKVKDFETADIRLNTHTHNRQIPYNLPADFKVKLFNFISHLGINTGSFDLILSNNGDIYFLELNRSGQFGYVSSKCNYYIEKYISLQFT